MANPYRIVGNPFSAGLNTPRTDSTKSDAVLRYVISRLRNLGISINWNTIRAFAANHRDEIAQATGSIVLSYWLTNWGGETSPPLT